MTEIEKGNYLKDGKWKGWDAWHSAETLITHSGAPYLILGRVMVDSLIKEFKVKNAKPDMETLKWELFPSFHGQVLRCHIRGWKMK